MNPVTNSGEAPRPKKKTYPSIEFIAVSELSHPGESIYRYAAIRTSR